MKCEFFRLTREEKLRRIRFYSEYFFVFTDIESPFIIHFPFIDGKRSFLLVRLKVQCIVAVEFGIPILVID
jgi:hypothetical protein